jgi:hypothetical protein
LGFRISFEGTGIETGQFFLKKLKNCPNMEKKTHLPSGVGIPTQLHIFSPNQAMQAALKCHNTTHNLENKKILNVGPIT